MAQKRNCFFISSSRMMIMGMWKEDGSEKNMLGIILVKMDEGVNTFVSSSSLSDTSSLGALYTALKSDANGFKPV